MRTLTTSETVSLGEAFLLANTPRSLLEWLKRSPTVQRLADDLSEDQLVDELQDRLSGAATELTLGSAYGLLVAIGIRRRRNGALGLMPLDSGALRWGRELWDRLETQGVGTSVASIQGQTCRSISVRSAGEGPPLLLDQHGAPIQKLRS